MIKLATAAGIIGGILLHSPHHHHHQHRVVSAWSTFHHATPAVHRRHHHHHHHQQQKQQLANPPPPSRSRSRWTNNGIINSSSGIIVLHALPEDDNGIDAAAAADPDAIDGSSTERRRKRDILKRTLGLGSGSSSSNNGENEEQPVKLNTDSLFKGMPGMDSILGQPQQSLSNVMMSDELPDDDDDDDDDDDSMSKMGFQTQGQRKKEPNLLTPDDIRELDSKYDSIQSQSEKLVCDELSKGTSGELYAGDKTDKGSNSDDGDSNSGGDTMNISQDEAKKIVDYAIAEEKSTEKRERDARKKEELVRRWESDGRAREESIDAEMANSDDDGASELETALRNDGVAREIIANADERDRKDEERASRRAELESYERRALRRRDAEGAYETATSKFRTSGEENNDDDDDDDDDDIYVDIDDVYEDSLSRIASSRSAKLGPQTLGVFANSIALEEGLEYVRTRKREREFLKEVEYHAMSEGVSSDEEVATFFKSPANRDEERMYRSIVRQIVNKREEVPAAAEVQRPEGEDGTAIDGGESEMAEESSTDSAAMEEDAKTKYKLAPKETVEAYKLLNLWREMRIEQDSMEMALGMKDDDDDDGYGRRRRPPSNKVEPFFLYEEDSEEKRQKEKEQLTKVLRKGLSSNSNDDVEEASNELLMKELLGGDAGSGITKERAVRLLDKLLSKTTDGTIRSSLEEMKVVILEEDDDGDYAMESRGDESSSSSSGPLDLSGVFRTSDMEEEEESKVSFPSKQPMGSNGGTGSPKTMPSWVDEEKKRESAVPPPPPPPPPPNTPFFSSSVEEEEATIAEDVKAPPPPNTPFFRSSAGGDDDAVEEGDGSPTGGMFGTYEEQRLRKLANKVGASSEEDMEELRRNMEAIKEAEEMATAQLSDDDFDIAAASAKLGIDVGSLNLDDEGDDRIASLIGKRPIASSSSSDRNRVVAEYDEYEETDEIIVDATGHLKKMEAKKERDIADDIFRAKTAGRQYRDRETRDADEAAFKEFVKMEEEAEREFDSADDDAVDEETMASSKEIDVDAYAEDIMSEIKPRPQIRGRREDVMSREEIFSERKKESIFGDDDPFPAKDDGPRTTASSSMPDGGAMPEWFRKEQEAQGIKVEDLDEDDFDEARREWEREERQKKADEYLKKRGEGISISDVLGREYFGPMDEPDDDYGVASSSFDSFEARKELLLGYSELTVEDCNNVIDFKVDPLATGYNRYLSRVQKPFSEYGAIFRLEGVLADMIGMHGKAWKAVAVEHGYKIQSGDEVKQASLYKPEDAVREVFRWTDDIFYIKDIAHTHRVAFREAFDKWLESGANAATASDGNDPEDSPNESSPKVTPSDEEMNSMYYLCWSKLSISLDNPPPTNDEVHRGVMGGDWEVAVKDIFGWSEDPSEIYDIVVAYDKILQVDYRVLLLKYGIDLDKVDADEEESLYGLQFPDLSLKEGVREWLDTLREVDMPIAIMTHLDSPQLDAILDATGLAEYFPPDKRVSSSDNYSSERSEMLGAALRVEQRPDECVIFDNTPHSSNEAHEIFMKSVSFVDHYARYELLTADLSVAFASDLDLISFVKLFDKRTDLEPALELDVTSGLQKQQRKVQTAFWDE